MSTVKVYIELPEGILRMKLNPADTIETIKKNISKQFKRPLKIHYISLFESDGREPLDEDSLLSTHIESANAWRETREEPASFGRPITLIVHLYRPLFKAGETPLRPATRFHFKNTRRNFEIWGFRRK